MVRRFFVVALGIVLIVSLVGANVVWAVDRGPLNPDHVAASAEESEIYAELEDEILERVAEEELSLPYPGLENRADEIIALVVTAEWLQAESERNLYNIFDTLENDEPLHLYVDFEEQRQLVERTFEAEFRMADLEIDQLDRLMASEQSYLEERDNLRVSLLAEIGVDPDDGFGVSTIQGLLAGPESYADTRADVRDDIADEAIDELEADAGFGNERLAGMYANPDTYAGEQTDFREQEKQRIQDETDEDLSDEELEERYAEQRDEIVDAAAADSVERIELEDAPESAQERAEDLAVLKAEGLATDLPHAEFTERYDDIVADIENDVIADVEENPEAYEEDVDDRVQNEIDEADAPAAVEDEIGGVADVTVEAIITDMTYEEYLVAYDAAVDDVESAAADDLVENRDEYDDEIEGTFGDFERDDVPQSMDSEADAVVDLVIQAVVTEMEYGPFMSQMEDRERDLGAALADALYEEEMIPTRFDFTDDVLDQAGDELDLAGQVLGLITPVAILLSGIALLLFGGIFAVTRDVATTALVGGSSSIAAGVPSVAVASLVPDLIADAMADVDVPEGLREAIVDMIQLVVFSPLYTQGLVLIGLGALLVGVGIVVRLELVDLPTDD